MARKYSLEDVELLRDKAGIGYEEAVALLDKYDGDIARAMVELEKRGHIAAGNAKRRSDVGESFWEWLVKLWGKGLRTRIQVMRRDTVLVNLSVVYLIGALLIAPHLMIISLVLLLLLGCRLSLLKNANLYSDESVQRFVDNAADNIRSSMASFTVQTGSDESDDGANSTDADARPRPQQVDDDDRDDGFDRFTVE